MTPEEEKELKRHIDAIADILYKQTKPEQLKSLSQNKMLCVTRE